MGLRNTSIEYGALAKALHWIVALGIFVLIYYGLLQDDMDKGAARDEVRFIHASIALAVFVLMSLRVAWRFLNPVPEHPAGTPAPQKLAADLVHWGLYVVVFVQLLSGMLIVATGGKPLPFFGLFSIPLPVAENHDLHEVFEEVHEVTWILLAVLVAAHVLGALYNHFALKNDVLRRMTHGVK
ncbi:MAG TPA: cytochrome b [Woeseiaceae bacterium]